MGAAVITGMDTPPIFEFSKHIFDFVAAFVERFVERNLQFSVGLWRDAWGNAALQQCITEPVGVISLVAEQGFGIRNGFEHEGSTLKIAHLAFGEQQNQRTARSITYGVQL